MKDEKGKPAEHFDEVVRAAQELLGALHTVAFDKLTADVAKEFADRMSPGFVELYAKHFSIEEIRGLSQFFRSDLGKTLLQKQQRPGLSWAELLGRGSGCSFCGMKEDEVTHLHAGPVAKICNGCVQICVDRQQGKS